MNQLHSMPEQTHPAGAVFLSYASQDTEAVERICEALRASGVEVWLDKSELRGGDAWDAQIRRQIHECTLFMPVISAHSNARTEGYFRREWKLATRRLLDMADDVAFLVPVVIDETREADARVPEEFLHAQWTRLPDGETPPAFAHRVRQLLGGDRAPVQNARSAGMGAHEPSARRERSAQSWLRLAGRGRHRVGRAGLALIALLLVLGGGAFWYHRAANDAPEKHALPTDAASIAVLPFVDMSPGKDQEYFADGMSEELLNLLSQLPKLHVIARTSSFSFKGKEADIATIARTLNVAHVLEGSVRMSGDTVRITVQLIRASDSTHLWSQTFDRKFNDVFKVQDEIARAVVAALQVKLLPAERERLAAVPTVNAEAYDAYLKGLYHWYKLTREDLDAAERYFNLALSKEPGYARAYAGIGLLWMGRNQVGISSPADGVPKAKAAALKAVELDDALADAHFVLACVYAWADWDWPAAEREFRRAIELNPGFADAHAYYAHLLNILHRPDEAMVEARRSLELDPFNGLFKSLYAVDLIFVHRFDEAIAQADAALLTNPTDLVALSSLMQAHHHKGNKVRALDFLKRYTSAQRYVEVTHFLAQNATGAHFSETMLGAAEALEMRSRTTFVLPMDIANLYCYAGDGERCLYWLERAYEVRDPNLPYLWYPDYDPVRNDPRFRDLLKRMKLPLK